ncbi:basic salivary proline-rich protein 2 [Passer montanus]|uniref:basic salivary proline-rich protein 2 n=1 Tax=Passer montanus TaxID=9160 RepID=UPI001960B0C9|nr:basic salivary proline-rich protein 2 [Passer montanus]
MAAEKHPLPPPRSPWQRARQRRQPGPPRAGGGPARASPVPPGSPPRPGAVRGAAGPAGRSRGCPALPSGSSRTEAAAAREGAPGSQDERELPSRGVAWDSQQGEEESGAAGTGLWSRLKPTQPSG